MDLMTDLHLYTPTYYNQTDIISTFNLYLCSIDFSAPKKEVKYSSTVPIIGNKTYNLNFFPVDSSTVEMSAQYSSDVGSLNLLLSSVGTGTYNNREYIVLTDRNAAYTPAPSAYLTPETGEILFPITNTTTYASQYTTGATTVAFSAGYEVPRLFTGQFYGGDILVDFGDNSGVQTFSFSGAAIDTLTHIYSSANTYDVSVTAQQLTGVEPDSYATLIQSFSDAIVVVESVSDIDEDVERINSDSNIIIPNTSPFIPVREWITHESINAVFKQLYDNFEYLRNAAKIYSLAPLYYNGWGHVNSVDNNHNVLQWHTDTFAPSSIQVNDEFSTITDMSSYIGASRSIYIGSPTRVEKFDYNLYDNTTIYDTDETETYELTTTVRSVAIDSIDRVFMLDSRKMVIKVYEYNSVQDDYLPIYEWGGIGGRNDLTSFYLPNDMFISNDKVYVTDSGNNCIKRYTTGGQWEYTYTSDSFTTGNIDTGSPISAILDNQNNLYVITVDRLIKITYDGEELFSIPIPNKTATPVKIHHHRGFIYILTQDNVIRVFENGESTNVFGVRTDLSSAIDPYTSIEIDTNGNIYLTDGKLIIRYIDSPILLDAAPRNSNYVSFDDMKVQPNAFVMPLTYNRFFDRLYDNLKRFYHTIEYKIIKASDGTLSRVQLENCDLGAFSGLLLDKEDIFIGMNELVTPEVMNRCIKQMLILQQYILDVLLNRYSACNTGEPESFKLNIEALGDCGWKWEDRKAGLCCLTWERIKLSCTTWEDAENC